MEFVKISDPKTLIFVIMVTIIIFCLIGFALFFKYYKIQNKTLKKIFNNQNLTYFSCVLGLIVAIIFASFVNFSRIDIHNVMKYMWVWECISYVYGWGMYLVAACFLTVWFMIPVVSWKAISKMVSEKKIVSLEFKKIGIILLLMGITIGISNFQWLVPFNDLNTPLTIFGVNDHTFQKDGWYLGAKFLFDNAFLTIWYPWLFLSFCLVTFVICWICAKLFYKKHPESDLQWPWKINLIFQSPYELFDALGSVGTFSFLICYFLFNIKSLFIHLGLMIGIFVGIFLIVNCILLLIIGINNREKHSLKDLLKISLHNNYFQSISINKRNDAQQYWITKIKNSPTQAWNLCDASVIGLAMTIYLGFSNNFIFNPDGSFGFNQNMYDFNFWFILLISGVFYNYLSYNQPANASLARNVMGASTYSITPGMQTGIFGWMMPSLKRCAQFTDNLIAVVV